MASRAVASFAAGFAGAFGGGLEFGSKLAQKQIDRNAKLRDFTKKQKIQTELDTERKKSLENQNAIKILGIKDIPESMRKGAFSLLMGNMGISGSPVLDNLSGKDFNDFTTAATDFFNNEDFKKKTPADQAIALGGFRSTWARLLPKQKSNVEGTLKIANLARIKEASAKVQQEQETRQRDSLITSLTTGDNIIGSKEELAGLSTDALQKIVTQRIEQVIKPKPIRKLTLLEKDINAINAAEDEGDDDKINILRKGLAKKLSDKSTITTFDPKSGAFTVETGNITGLSTVEQRQFRSQIFEVKKTLRVMDQIEDILKPGSVGSRGITKSIAQDFLQQVNPSNIDAGAEALFDKDLPSIQLLGNTLAYAMARAEEPGGRLSERDVQAKVELLAIEGFNTSAFKIKSVFDTLRVKLIGDHNSAVEVLTKGFPLEKITVSGEKDLSKLSDDDALSEFLKELQKTSGGSSGN